MLQKLSLVLMLVIAQSATARAGERITTPTNRFSIDMPAGWSVMDNEDRQIEVIGDGFPGKFGITVSIFPNSTPADKATLEFMLAVAQIDSSAVSTTLSNGLHLRYAVDITPPKDGSDGIFAVNGEMEAGTSAFIFLSTVYNYKGSVAAFNTKPFLDALKQIAASIQSN